MAKKLILNKLCNVAGNVVQAKKNKTKNRCSYLKETKKEKELCYKQIRTLNRLAVRNI